MNHTDLHFIMLHPHDSSIWVDHTLVLVEAYRDFLENKIKIQRLLHRGWVAVVVGIAHNGHRPLFDKNYILLW